MCSSVEELRRPRHSPVAFLPKGLWSNTTANEFLRHWMVMKCSIFPPSLQKHINNTNTLVRLSSVEKKQTDSPESRPSPFHDGWLAPSCLLACRDELSHTIIKQSIKHTSSECPSRSLIVFPCCHAHKRASEGLKLWAVNPGSRNVTAGENEATTWPKSSFFCICILLFKCAKVFEQPRWLFGSCFGNAKWLEQDQPNT